jgi:hypothetical protein
MQTTSPELCKHGHVDNQRTRLFRHAGEIIHARLCAVEPDLTARLSADLTESHAVGWTLLCRVAARRCGSVPLGPRELLTAKTAVGGAFCVSCGLLPRSPMELLFSRNASRTRSCNRTGIHCEQLARHLHSWGHPSLVCHFGSRRVGQSSALSYGTGDVQPPPRRPGQRAGTCSLTIRWMT